MLKKNITLFISALLLISTFTSCAKADTDKATAEKFMQTLLTCPNQTIITGQEEWEKAIDSAIHGEETSKRADKILNDAFTEVFGDMVAKEAIPLRLVTAGNIIWLNEKVAENNMTFTVSGITVETEDSPKDTYLVTANVTVSIDDSEDMVVKVSVSTRFKDKKIDYFRVSANDLYDLFEIV